MFRPLCIWDGHIRGEDFIVIVLVSVHVFCPLIPKVLTGDVPFRQIPDQAVITRVLRGSRPEIPVDTSAAAHRSGLWEIVQQCWEQSPMERPALPAVRDRLSVAAGMWDVNLGQSGTIDGFVDVDPCILLESDDSSDAGKRPCFSLHLRLCSHAARE